jgi:hypothetical protein
MHTSETYRSGLPLKTNHSNFDYIRVWRAQFRACSGKGRAHLVAKRRRRRGSTKREAPIAQYSSNRREGKKDKEGNRRFIRGGDQIHRAASPDRNIGPAQRRSSGDDVDRLDLAFDGEAVAIPAPPSLGVHRGS